MPTALFLAFNPPPNRKKGVAKCERKTLRAWKMLSAHLPEWLVDKAEIAEQQRLALAALRLRCQGCAFRHLSPILPKLERRA